MGSRASRRRSAAALAVLAVLAAGTARSAAAEPRAALTETVRDFGRVAPGDPVAHEFTVANEGDTALVLGDPRATRGAVVERYDATVGPGQTGRIRVATDTWAFRGAPPLTATVSTNDPARPAITVGLKVNVEPYVLASPGHARYLTYQGGPPGTVTQTLWEATGAEFRVLGVESPYPFLAVAFREARPDERDPERPGPQWRVDGTIGSEPAVGALLGFIRVRLDHPKQRELRIALSGFVRPMLAVTPPAAALGDVDPAQAPTWTLVVKSYAEGAVDLSGATTDVPGFRAEVVPVTPGRTYALQLTVSGDAPPGPFDGTIRVRTSSARQAVLEVPLRGRVVAATPALPAATPRGRE